MTFKITLPSDKSITHRAFILSALATGKSKLDNVGQGADLRSTRTVLSQLGVKIEKENQSWIIHGKGWQSPFQKSLAPLDCGNSGTTSRLMMGLLCAQNFESTLIGDASLSKRPMLRLSTQLSAMGGHCQCASNGSLPVQISAKHSSIQSGHYHTNSSSAQIKSSMLLAGLYANDLVQITEHLLSRDHTERMFESLGINIHRDQLTLTLSPLSQPIAPLSLAIPGDFSSACFWIAASLISHRSLWIENVNLNPTRTGFLDIIAQMGGKYQIHDLHLHYGEEVGDLEIFPSELSGIQIDETLALRALDELPLVALLASVSKGQTEVRGAKELRVKESDRIEAMTINLRKLGIDIESLDDGWRIEGGDLNAGTIDSFEDHRIAMTFRIARLKSKGHIQIIDEACAQISYPEFNALFDDIFAS
jgi:3-phosphoshikimate 1-carboxyvinyltransferase